MKKNVDQSRISQMRIKQSAGEFILPNPVLRSRRVFFEYWFYSLWLTVGIATCAYATLRILDHKISLSNASLFETLFLTEIEVVGDALGGVSEVLIAILGLVITVVAIVVQLAAQRYTPKLIELFINDAINRTFFVLMVLACIYSILLVYSTSMQFLPFWGSVFLLFLTTLILSLLIPYFNYVFIFLTPNNVVATIRLNTRKSIAGAIKKPKPKELQRIQRDIALSMEQISDIALSAVEQKDRNEALLSIRTLKEILVDYILLKAKMPRQWFAVYRDTFPSLSSDFINEIISTRIWVEAKCFMDLELIFKSSIVGMPDAVSSIANNTKTIGQYAIRLNERYLLSFVVQYFNTFLRFAVTNHNARAIYNLLYQYRMLAEEILIYDSKLAVKIASYFKYYGQTAQNFNIPLILITTCFDLEHLLEQAYIKKSPCFRDMLKIFLEIDDSRKTRENEFELRSVRKAQLRFAAFALSMGDEKIVKLVIDDMKMESWERMDGIWNEMITVTDRKFWEITDRGVDFFYMDPQRKSHLKELYERHIIPLFKPLA